MIKYQLKVNYMYNTNNAIITIINKINISLPATSWIST